MEYYYKLIKEYPRSPELGTITNSAMTDYYRLQPEKWKDFWQKIKYGEDVITTADGVSMKVGKSVYFVSETGQIKSLVCFNGMDLKRTYFSGADKALSYKIDNIKLLIENELILGEDIMLYGVCAKAQWNLMEILSSKLYYRTTKMSDSWKFFRTIEERNEFIFRKKPRFSFEDVLIINSWSVIGGEGEIRRIIEGSFKL